MTPDGKSKYFVDRKFTIYMVAFIVTVTLVILYAVNHPRKTYPYTSCPAMNVAGYYGVTSKQPQYNPALDKDHNGIECK